ncbi:pimeloyl-ACP methyl ester carboxylesterase [Shimia isoporae]|uniref:Pimeloyl-ACP methyl ester carboxylesterase n=1 Tax=Shimia isoporae TaxID=647720 RepID=A0A4V2Q441_9RHOB|nr:alpha/beta hydrolase [Shimia isoporae]TCL09650.1 pimeloyl-ACP methyl ester carboxylesterase [Shimia isoporae]
MPFADLNGAHIHYTDTGGQGEAVVMSHGLLHHGGMFAAQVAHLKERYRVITFDHRGQGQSGVTESGYDMDTLCEDAAALIEHLGVGPCHYVGLSMGGMVGMRLAARRPELLKTMTLLNTSAEAEPASNRPKYKLMNLCARWLGLGSVVGGAMQSMFGQTFLKDPARAEERAFWRKSMKSGDRIGVTRAVAAVFSREGCEALLGQIDLPVGIGAGEEDVATVPEKSERIAAAIRGSQLKVFKGAGHSSTIETPDQVNALIDATIARAAV